VLAEAECLVLRSVEVKPKPLTLSGSNGCEGVSGIRLGLAMKGKTQKV